MSLGRGLESLIPVSSIKKVSDQGLSQTKEEVCDVLVNQIEANPDQPRKSFQRTNMEELINSIQAHGIIQPLILSKKEGGKYEIIAGERRWRSAKILNLKTVPALIRPIDYNKKLEISLIENIQRKDLNAMEKAKAYQRLMDEFNLTQEKISERLGLARATVANALRLLRLPQIIQEAIEQEKISEGHAKILCSFDSAEKQKAFLKRILGLGLTVRETDQMAKAKKFKKKKIMLNPELEEREKKLSQFLGTKVKIKKSQSKIKVLIEVYKLEDLDIIIKKIKADN
ncbi:ParB/RepB/Spo0J family partition protein [Patescibacteria group bacterium]|nr:ParB/RepB/Spo0J family partition protein [Patescibacteria group bacterium]